ncbi:MAG: hypothetical protein H6839_01230 [Planctomycetes bacterium]|nr:hypothetical protein [Planctomycetota bacterium]
MSTYRTVALAVIILGAVVLAYGIWSYYDSRSELRVGDASIVIQDAEVSPAVWIGGAVILVGGAAMVTARGKRA